MNYFNKKQKIILGGIVAIIAGVIYYHTYSKNDYNTQIENNFEVQEESKVEEVEDKILVHISGAIKKEGVIELKENSRISDAINQARRSDRRC